MKNRHAAALGKRGGKVGGLAKTNAKTAAARANGAKGGRWTKGVKSGWWAQGWHRLWRESDGDKAVKAWARLQHAEDAYQRANKMGRYSLPNTQDETRGR